jgi:hypothetical protein
MSGASLIGVAERAQVRLIQSQTPESGLTSHRVSVADSNLYPIPGMSQAHIPALVRRVLS